MTKIPKEFRDEFKEKVSCALSLKNNPICGKELVIVSLWEIQEYYTQVISNLVQDKHKEVMLKWLKDSITKVKEKL